MLSRIFRFVSWSWQQLNTLRPLTTALILLAIPAVLCAQTSFAPSASFPSANQRDDAQSWHFRYDLFQMLFEQNGLRPIQDFESAFNSPNKTVIVLLGTLRDQRPPVLEKFLNEGGALLLASDMSFGFAQGNIRRGPVLAMRPDDIYQGHPDCLRIRDINPSHELADGVKQLITNRSGWIIEQPELDTSDWRVMASLPSTTFQRDSQSRPIVSSMISKRLIVVADHSLFTNGMMWHGDNALFAINVSRSLCRGGRNQVLFAVDGLAANSYLMGPLANELPLPMPPPEIEPELDLDQMLQVANQVVTEVEDSDAFNKLLANRPRSLPDPYYRRALLFVLSGMLIALSLYKLGGKMSKPTPPAVAVYGNVPPGKNRSIGAKAISVVSSALSRAAQGHVGGRGEGGQQVGGRQVGGRQVGGRRGASSHVGGATSVVSPIERGEVAQRLAQHFCREVTASDDPQAWLRELTGRSQTSEQLAHVLSLAVQNKPPHLSESMLLDIAKQVAEIKLQHKHQST